VVLASLFAAAALISGFTVLRGIDPFDEGLVLQAAHRVSAGQTPYADFLWPYGPALPYLLGGLFKAFGVSLVQWRLLRVLADAGVALVVFVLLRRTAGPRVALLGWLAAACEMAEPRGANPFPFAMLAALLALAVITGPSRPRRRVVGAALLTGVAAAFRLDFALYGAAAVIAVLLLQDADMPWRRRIQLAAGYFGLTALLVLVVYGPWLISIGPSRLYDALVATSLRERDYWTLPFPLGYGGPLRAWPPGALAHDLKDVLDYYQPLLLLAGVGLAVLSTAARARRSLAAAAPSAGMCVFALGALSYLLSRTDEFHAQPLSVALCVLLPGVAALPLPDPGRRTVLLRVLAGCVFALLLAHGVANRLSALLRPPALSAVHVAAADGAEAPPAEARALERVVADIRARVPSGQPIYVAPARSDLVRYNNSIVYVLAQRDNASRRDFGLLTGAAAQRSLVDRLRAARPRVVVRWTDPLSSVAEPNLRGRPTGVHLLDDYLRSDYRLLERLYHYDVLVRSR
jgi:Dolichyl-phosphate-mannose-protein mannosyltransferase